MNLSPDLAEGFPDSFLVLMSGYRSLLGVKFDLQSMHALCPSPRNSTDKQLDAIKETGGLACVNFHPAFVFEQSGMMGCGPCGALLDDQMALFSIVKAQARWPNWLSFR